MTTETRGPVGDSEQDFLTLESIRGRLESANLPDNQCSVKETTLSGVQQQGETQPNPFVIFDIDPFHTEVNKWSDKEKGEKKVELQKTFRTLQKLAHPDTTGNSEISSAINVAKYTLFGIIDGTHQIEFLQSHSDTAPETQDYGQDYLEQIKRMMWGTSGEHGTGFGPQMHAEVSQKNPEVTKEQTQTEFLTLQGKLRTISTLSVPALTALLQELNDFNIHINSQVRDKVLSGETYDKYIKVLFSQEVLQSITLYIANEVLRIENAFHVGSNDTDGITRIENCVSECGAVLELIYTAWGLVLITTGNLGKIKDTATKERWVNSIKEKIQRFIPAEYGAYINKLKSEINLGTHPIDILSREKDRLFHAITILSDSNNLFFELGKKHEILTELVRDWYSIIELIYNYKSDPDDFSYNIDLTAEQKQIFLQYLDTVDMTLLRGMYQKNDSNTQIKTKIEQMKRALQSN